MKAEIAGLPIKHSEAREAYHNFRLAEMESDDQPGNSPLVTELRALRETEAELRNVLEAEADEAEQWRALEAGWRRKRSARLSGDDPFLPLGERLRDIEYLYGGVGIGHDNGELYVSISSHGVLDGKPELISLPPDGTFQKLVAYGRRLYLRGGTKR